TALAETLRTETDTGVGAIVLTRASEYNTITPALRGELAAAIDELDTDPAVRVILLRAEGPAFCAGYGLDWSTRAQAAESQRAAGSRGRGRGWAAGIGMILETVPDDELEERSVAFARRMAQVPTTQLVMLKLLCNQTAENMGLASSRTLGSLFDGIARHTQEGLDFVHRSQEVGF